ncbi:MAG: hypothetical protein ACI90M_003918, partial [Candidatus Azotimanducaceae bacterium]
MALLTARATAGDLDLTAHGRIDGMRTSLLYEPVSSQFISEQPGMSSLTAPQLLAKANSNAAALVFTGVPPGSGQRIHRSFTTIRQRPVNNYLIGKQSWC